MAKQCSICGKKLTFRNSFYYENKPICRDCLRAIEQTRQGEISKPAKKPRRKGLGKRIFYLTGTLAIFGLGLGVYSTGGVMAIRFVNINLSLAAFTLIFTAVIIIEIIDIINFLQRKQDEQHE